MMMITFAPVSAAVDEKARKREKEREGTRFQGTASLEASGFGWTDTQNEGNGIMQAPGTTACRRTRAEEGFSCSVTMQ